MNLFVRIGAVVDGSLGRALNGLNNDLSRMDRTAQQLTARQQRLGTIMSQSMTRPHADLGRMQQQYDRIGQAINRVTSAQNLLNQSIERGRQIGELRDAAGGHLANSTAQLAAFAVPVGMAVKQAAEFKDQVIDLSITAGWSAQEQARIGETVRKSALNFNQSTTDINAGLGVIVAGGISSVKDIETYAPKLTKAVTATRSSWEDIGAMTIAMQKNLGIGAKDWDKSMNMLIASSKAGQFEVKDMAKHLPSLTPYYQALGIQGEQAILEIGSNLQIARIGAGSADEAANNYKNFLGKITSNDTKEAFKKAGIDLQESMKNLVGQGMTAPEAMFKLMTDYMGTKSPKAAAEFTKAMSIKDDKERQMAVDRLAETYKLGELFADQQTLGFIRPRLGNQDELAKVQSAMKVGGGQDLMGKDFNTRMQSPTEQFKNVKLQVADLGITIGNALLPAVNQTLVAVKPMITAFGNWAKQNPQLVASIVKIVGGLLVAKVAFWGMSFAVLSVVKPIASAVTLFNRLRAGVAVLRGMAILGRFAPMAARFASGLRLIGTAFQALRIILMANPLGLAIGLLITAAVLIYRNWSPIKAFFIELWTGIKTTATNAMNAIKAVIANFHPIQYFTSAFAAVMGYLGGLPARFRTYGVNMIQGLIGGITAKFGELKAKMSEMANTVSSFFASKLGIRSPSRVFMGFGRNIAEGVAIGIGQQTPTAVKASDAMAKRLSQTEYSNKVLGRQSVTGGMGTGTIHFSPTIHVNGGGGDVSGQVQQGLQAGYREFLAMLERVERDRGRRAFA